MIEKIKQILIDHLTKMFIPTHCQSNTSIIHYKFKSFEYYIANIICGEIDIKDDYSIITIANLINHNFQNLEISESEIENITESIIKFKNKEMDESINEL